MNGLLKGLLVACALVQVVYGAYPMGPANQQSLASLFFRSRLASQDPAISMACFSHYIENSNEIGERYSKGYNECLMNAKAGRKAIETEMTDKRFAIAEGSQNVCQRFLTCNELNTTLDMFNCHSNIGANNTKSVYSISGNASEYANIMSEQYRIIDLRHEQCCKLAERAYVETTAVNYRDLQDCLEGRIKPTTTTTTTTTTPKSTTTTPEPSSTTTSGPPTPPVVSSTTTQPPPSTSEIPIETSSVQSETELPTMPALAAETEQFARLLKLFK